MAHQIDLPPNASQLIEGLRDTGYEFFAAIADIVDNSIDADASRVEIRIEMEPDGALALSIADNGCGMSGDELKLAMTYGAIAERKNPKRLGHFGLGLKTASTAFCRRLCVITRSRSSSASKAVWDLDHVAKVNRWELLFDDVLQPHEERMLDECAGTGSGTVVVWERIDRLLGEYKSPDGKPRRKALKQLCDGLVVHLGMVYQRFLDMADKRARDVSMSVNGEAVAPWDPFQESNPESRMVSKNRPTPVELEDGSKHSFTCRAFVLPNKHEYPNTDQGRQAYAASRIGNNTQGIYIYREDRLILAHDWLGMRSKEPHFSLLRVDFSFGHELDAFFRVDIKKSRIELESGLYDWLERYLSAPARDAESRYRLGERVVVKEKSRDAHDGSNSNIGGKEAQVINSEVTVVDRSSGTVDVKNPFGTTRIKILVEEDPAAKQLHVRTEESLDDGLLWQPGLTNGHHAVVINRSHPYYTRVYVPNLSKSVTIQGMDALLWSLTEAEFSNMNKDVKVYFENLRREVSRILRTLVADLPEPKLEDGESRVEA
jgi:hypothetical protein